GARSQEPGARMTARIGVFLWLACASLAFAQAPAAKQEQRKPEDVVRLWFERWNALDGSEQATTKLLELYLPNAFAQTGPNEKQMGQVWFEGHAAIRKMAEDFAKVHSEISYRIAAVVANEATVEMIHVAKAPWGGVSAAVEFVAAYTTRKDNRRWMVPGAAFFQIQDGRI